MLDYLDERHQLDDIEANGCQYVVTMIEEHIVKDRDLPYSKQLEQQLQKIVFQAP